MTNQDLDKIEIDRKAYHFESNKEKFFQLKSKLIEDSKIFKCQQ